MSRSIKLRGLLVLFCIVVAQVIAIASLGIPTITATTKGCPLNRSTGAMPLD
jgi:hypothetical protein